ncbi:hypothetical protein [Lignipirellula cremea]|nr:hypothetical protein [Lignipirellula cremea]
MTNLRIKVIRGSILGAVILGFLAVNFLGTLASLSESNLFVMEPVVGAVVAQLVLLAAWAVLGPGNWVWRWPCCLALAAAAWYAMTSGIRVYLSLGGDIRYDSIFPTDGGCGGFLLMGLMLVWGLILACIPLAIAAGRFGWRMTYDPEAARSERAGFHFQLKHLLLAIAFIGLMLAPARFVLPPVESSGIFESLTAVNGDFLFVLAAGSVFMVFQLAIVLLFVWGAFRQSDEHVEVIPVGIVYASVLILIESALAVAPGGSGDEVLLIILLVHFVECAGVFLPLLALRLTGLQLVRISTTATAREGISSDPDQA